MGAASAQVFIHAGDDFVPRRGGIISQQAVGFEDHSGCTKAALETDMLDKRFLKRMQSAVLGESFNGCNLAAVDVLYRLQTGKHGGIVGKHRTGAA